MLGQPCKCPLIGVPFSGSSDSPGSAQPATTQLRDVLPPGNQQEGQLRQLLLSVLLGLCPPCRSSVVLADTHDRGHLQNPVIRIGISALASSARVWAGLIAPFEVSVLQSDLAVTAGQLADRCLEACSQQPGRKHIYGVAMFVDAIDVFCFHVGGDMITSVQHSGLIELSISPASPGLQLLARMLLASREQLGYIQPALTPPIRLHDRELLEPELLATCREDGRGSIVYGVSLADGNKAVLKLVDDPHEVSSGM